MDTKRKKQVKGHTAILDVTVKGKYDEFFPNSKATHIPSEEDKMQIPFTVYTFCVYQ